MDRRHLSSHRAAPPSTTVDTREALDIATVARMRGLSVKAVYTRLEKGVFLPLPFATRPYRWSQDDMKRCLAGEFRQAEEDLRRRADGRRAPTLRLVDATDVAGE